MKDITNPKSLRPIRLTRFHWEAGGPVHTVHCAENAPAVVGAACIQSGPPTQHFVSCVKTYVPSWTHDGIGICLRGYAQIAKRGNRSYLNCTVTVGTRRRCLQGEALPYPMEHLNTCKLYDEYFTTSLKKPILMDSLLTCLRSTPTISVSSTQQYSKTKKKYRILLP